VGVPPTCSLTVLPRAPSAEEAPFSVSTGVQAWCESAGFPPPPCKNGPRFLLLAADPLGLGERSPNRGGGGGDFFQNTARFSCFGIEISHKCVTFRDRPGKIGARRLIVPGPSVAVLSRQRQFATHNLFRKFRGGPISPITFSGNRRPPRPPPPPCSPLLGGPPPSTGFFPRITGPGNYERKTALGGRLVPPLFCRIPFVHGASNLTLLAFSPMPTSSAVPGRCPPRGPRRFILFTQPGP